MFHTGTEHRLVSIPKRVLEALNRLTGIADAGGLVVSIPKRVLEALNPQKQTFSSGFTSFNP